MVADDEVDTALVGVVDFLDRLDAAVKHNNKAEAMIGSVVDAFI